MVRHWVWVKFKRIFLSSFGHISLNHSGETLGYYTIGLLGHELLSSSLPLRDSTACRCSWKKINRDSIADSLPSTVRGLRQVLMPARKTEGGVTNGLAGAESVSEVVKASPVRPAVLSLVAVSESPIHSF